MLNMLSAFIYYKRGYPALLLAKQPEHYWFKTFDPFVQKSSSLNIQYDSGR
jgi:hypothetical protein